MWNKHLYYRQRVEHFFQLHIERWIQPVFEGQEITLSGLDLAF